MKDIPFGRSWEMFCQKRDDHRFPFDHFGSRLYVKMCLTDTRPRIDVSPATGWRAIHKVRLTITEDGPLWGWWDAKHDDISMVYWSKLLNEMCFTYGSRVEEERDRGRVVRLNVDDLGIE